MLTVASLGSFMFLMFRRDLKLGRDHDKFDSNETDKG
jgi:protein SCO1/2